MQTISEGVFYKFGTRSLVIKMFKNLLVSALFLAVFIVLISTKNNEIWSQMDSLVGIAISGWIFKIILGIVVLSVFVQIISALISYITMQFMISSTSLSLRTGFFVKQENSFPLRYIQNVSNNQNILDQLFGVGTCIVEMTSDEKDSPHSDRLVLSDLDQQKMLELKDILLTHTNIQQITVAPVAPSVQQ